VGVAERCGFDSVWVGETYSFGMPAPLQWLAALAPQTSLRIGTGVLLLPAWEPLRLAAETAVLDALSGGRLELGVGVARRPVQVRFGVEPTTVATFADEVLEMLRVLWGGGQGFAGSIVRVEGGIEPLPVQPGGPPIWVGGAIRRSVLRAATFGDGWYASTTYSTHQIAQQAERYRTELAARGNGSQVQIAANRLTVVAETDEEADELGARYLGPVLRRYATNGSLGEAWRSDPATPEETFRRLRDEYCLVGSADTVAARMAEYQALGVTHVHARAFPDEAPPEVAAQTVAGLAEAVRLMTPQVTTSR
jgi:alkanesulfonate monooxygenase SsuD/methylene tetrahydromethanopterin reductase-like flavin-dependent oxidoreductase (luciferase family)